MGQSLDLCFVSAGAITYKMLEGSLVKAGLHRKGGEERVSVDYLWPRRKLTVELLVNVHSSVPEAGPLAGQWQHYVFLSVLSRYFHDVNAVEFRELLQDFVLLGQELWKHLDLDEGILAPEDTGGFLIQMEAPTDEDLRAASRWSYAHFTSPELQRRLHLPGALKNLERKPMIKSIQKGGLLVVWDDSSEGVANFLALF